ncbi:MAG: hypothetical protein ACN4EP_10230, partial [Sediminibacterium sp.]
PGSCLMSGLLIACSLWHVACGSEDASKFSQDSNGYEPRALIGGYFRLSVTISMIWAFELDIL